MHTVPERALSNRNFFSHHAVPTEESLMAIKNATPAARVWRAFFIVFFGDNLEHNAKRFVDDDPETVDIDGTQVILRFRHRSGAMGETLM